MGIMISNVQRMSFDDGPGVRTTVFLKGCSIACPWCSNPENIKFEKQCYYDKERCKKGDNFCIYNKDCILLKDNNMDLSKIENTCPLNAVGYYGREYEAQELVEELLKDQYFWGETGGVTFSGGEALLHTSELIEVWKLLKEKNIHITVETALFVPRAYVEQAVKYIDLFYVDLKILETQMCKEILGGNVELYLQNVEYLSCCGKEIVFRIPCVKEYVLREENWEKICDFLCSYTQYPAQIFAVHDLGKKKYQTLGYHFQEFERLSNEQLEKYSEDLKQVGCSVEIIQI